MRIGLISDTHGHFDPRLPELFAGVEHILHAGDIGPPEIIAKLERLAPVTAVLGNNDFDPSWKETETMELAGLKFLVHHIVPIASKVAGIFDAVRRLRPHVVVFGHTHQPHDSMRDGVRYLNPGYAGRQRFKQERSVALADLADGEVRRLEFVPL